MSDVQYARAGDTHVAYRVIGGSGDHDVVMVSGFYFPIELLPEDPVSARLLDGLAELGRLVVFDRRGVGLSDPITDWNRPLIEQWTDDLAAVIDAAGCERPVIFAWDELGVGRCYAARNPERVAKLVLLSPLPAPGPEGDRWHDDFWDAEQSLVAGETSDVVEQAFPSRAGDPGFRQWLERAGRLGASPTLARRVAEALARQLRAHPIDHRRIKTPTLVLHRPRVPIFQPGVVERVAAEIEGAQFVTLPGEDNLVVGDDVDVLLSEVSRFVTGEARTPPPVRALGAVLFTDVVGSTERAAAAGDSRWKSLLDHHDAATARAVSRNGGRVVKTTGDGVLAIFPAATAALRAAGESAAELRLVGLDIRIGIHVGEIETRGDDVAGLAVHVAARVMAAAEPGEVLVSATVPPAVIGSDATFEPRGVHALKGVPGEWALFAARDHRAPARRPR